MHEFIMSIGYAILAFFTNINLGTVLQALEITLIGWLGIFVVTIVIICVVSLLTYISRKLPAKD